MSQGNLEQAIKELMSELGVSRKVVLESIDSLEEKGYLTALRNADGEIQEIIMSH